MRLCPYCDHNNDDNEKFCKVCGRPIQDVKGKKQEDKEWREDIKKA